MAPWAEEAAPPHGGAGPLSPTAGPKHSDVPHQMRSVCNLAAVDWVSSMVACVQQMCVCSNQRSRAAISAAAWHFTAGSDDTAELPPGTCIAVQLDARGGRLHDWLNRKVTGAAMPAVEQRLGTGSQA
jgi:hypothetical protein